MSMGIQNLHVCTRQCLLRLSSLLMYLPALLHHVLRQPLVALTRVLFPRLCRAPS